MLTAPPATALAAGHRYLHFLKQKRSLVRPVTAELHPMCEVGAAEAGDLDLHRRALPGAAVVSDDTAHLHQVLGSCE